MLWNSCPGSVLRTSPEHRKRPQSTYLPMQRDAEGKKLEVKRDDKKCISKKSQESEYFLV